MRSMKRTLDVRVLRNIALVCLADGLVGMSYGAIAVGSGLDAWLPVALSVLVLAGSAEFLFVGIVAAGGSPIAATIAGLLVNARHLPFGLAVGDVLGRGQRRVLGAHLMNDESVVFALGETDPGRRRAAYWACGVGIAVCWPLGAVLGAVAGTAIGDPAVLGLDAMFPAVLLALVLPAVRDRDVRVPVLAGGVIALATTPFLPAGLPVLAALVGLLAGVRRKVLR
ncbi:AzlC family ABC transporter permease [Rhodococcus opacus]|uniref:AzlC family ABC transporter permease n=1 Tax=Rhodococcus opacus TaxID=37919 RepID=UPI000EA97CC5|nr:AzlC family ABC transporter permease [Rhodococcus opacus]QZS56264.1 AzlC family ABC transporter permease [Rhodococcus opacus]QZS56288.1 AzlC family ABC transporter permease [Rhodococcus opacus]RKM70665.1 branched-chain amino acid permease [Rhodococcus opacus]RKM77070.1 branched-chain amino acid permease [Rhodococcus opacus]